LSFAPYSAIIQRWAWYLAAVVGFVFVVADATRPWFGGFAVALGVFRTFARDMAAIMWMSTDEQTLETSSGIMAVGEVPMLAIILLR
jgi:hypothetical protein